MAEDRKWAIKALNNGDDEKFKKGWERIWGPRGPKCPKDNKKCTNCDNLCEYRIQR